MPALLCHQIITNSINKLNFTLYLKGTYGPFFYLNYGVADIVNYKLPCIFLGNSACAFCKKQFYLKKTEARFA